MGTVFEAEHLHTAARVAIKLMRSTATRDTRSVRRFIVEAQAATAIDHPNIVRVIDLHRADTGEWYLVQELLRGRDLSAQLAEHGPMQPRAVMELMVPVMGALVAAHRRGIVHRDLKPENLFLVKRSDGSVSPKVIDFGISKVMFAESSGATTAGSILGTVQYMAPEQARGEPDVDARADVFSLGAVLFELLSGKRPFDGRTPQAVLVKLMTERAPSLRIVMSSLPADLAAVIDGALEPSRESRTPSVSALLDGMLACPSVGPVTGASPWTERFREALIEYLSPSSDVPFAGVESEGAGDEERVSRASTDHPPTERMSELPGTRVVSADTGDRRSFEAARTERRASQQSVEGAVVQSSTADPVERSERTGRAEPFVTTMQRRVGRRLALGLGALLGVGGAVAFTRWESWRKPPPPRAVIAPAPPLVVPLSVWISPEKEPWLRAATERFARAHPLVRVELRALSSLEARDAILAGEHPSLWSPADSSVLELLDAEWRRRHAQTACVHDGTRWPRALASSPLVFVGWRSVLSRLPIPPEGLGWRSLSRWMRRGPPLGRRLRVGVSDPVRSNAGLQRLVLLANDALVDNTLLRLEDTRSAAFLTLLTEVERGLPEPSPDAGRLVLTMVNEGPSAFDMVQVYESQAIELLGQAITRWEPLRVLYPRETVWSDHPLCMLQVRPMEAGQREAAERFADHLRTVSEQRSALTAGMRPVAAELTPDGGPDDPFTRNIANGLRWSVPPAVHAPTASVYEALVASWRTARGRGP